MSFLSRLFSRRSEPQIVERPVSSANITRRIDGHAQSAEVAVLDVDGAIWARSQALMDRYEFILPGASEIVLRRIYVEGSKILCEMSAETVNAANILADAKNHLAAAIRDPRTPAYALYDRERELPRLELDHARKLEAFETLSAFLERVKSLIEERD